MTTEGSDVAPGRLQTLGLPCLLGFAAIVNYFLTLNPWVSLGSLNIITRISGWSWQSDPYQPLTATAIYPFGLLPEAWRPLGLNIFTALCAALVLVVLARSVALLRPRRTAEVTEGGDKAVLPRTVAWMPQTLAVSACGLQLSFWEHATAATGSMVSLL